MKADHIIRVAEAIKKATDEHGRPNTFSCRDLCDYGAPEPMITGQIGSRYMLSLWQALGGESWGMMPTYVTGVFAIDC